MQRKKAAITKLPLSSSINHKLHILFNPLFNRLYKFVLDVQLRVSASRYPPHHVPYFKDPHWKTDVF